MNVEFTNYDYKINHVSHRLVITLKFSDGVFGHNCYRMTSLVIDKMLYVSPKDGGVGTMTKQVHNCFWLNFTKGVF